MMVEFLWIASWVIIGILFLIALHFFLKKIYTERIEFRLRKRHTLQRISRVDEKVSPVISDDEIEEIDEDMEYIIQTILEYHDDIDNR